MITAIFGNRSITALWVELDLVAPQDQSQTWPTVMWPDSDGVTPLTAALSKLISVNIFILQSSPSCDGLMPRFYTAAQQVVVMTFKVGLWSANKHMKKKRRRKKMISSLTKYNSVLFIQPKELLNMIRSFTSITWVQMWCLGSVCDSL